ncbi:MAG: VWA domain-containing protein, partial [Candidatus Omnitrophica bacterium]|nr:VWA domain-containing protein [Candidatus Omnitrophota bacterium]
KAGKEETSIEDALLLARETMPNDSVNRVVLFTDGNETRGDSIDFAKRLSQHGIQVFTQRYEADEKDEVLLEDLLVPSEVKKGQSFNVTAVAHSVRETSATLILYRDGFKVQEREMTLEAGKNNLVFQENNPGDGLTKYELHVKAEKDFYSDNNVSSGVVFISGEPKVLLLEGEEREARYLSRALGAENIRVEVREGKGMPGTLDELAAYDAVIFSDVPAPDVSVQQMNLLRSYVEDLGGGFVMIGGEESFGLGGYYRTSIEDALPVRMRSEKKKETPSLAMMLIIDKSGSMSGEKVQLAKEAAISTVELLSDRDYVGVIAFDGAPYWVVDMQGAGNRLGIVQAIESIEASGGTNMYPAMEEGYTALSQIPAAYKHVILLTDGISQPGDFGGVVDRMVNELMTVSTVAVGEGADTNLLQDIARWGRGRYYFTADAYDIPQIFTKETVTASKSSLVEEPFLPMVFHPHQVIDSIDWDTAPFLFGYVVTSPKSTAEVLLVSERGDPLLATWRFGLGRTVAFTSDAKSRWAADWLTWPGYGKFWAQVIRDVMRTSQNQGTETSLMVQGNDGAVSIDNVDGNGRFINGLETTAQLIRPNLEVATLRLNQSAPGRYETQFPMTDTGSYLLKIRQTAPPTEEGGERQTLTDFTRGVTISYKPEYRHLSTDEGFLSELATVTGGAPNPTMDRIFNVSEDERVAIRKQLWPWLLMAALILFVLDVALRRLDLAGKGLFGSPQRYG